MQQEATLFNNMAACYKKDQHSKLEVECTTKVLERSQYIDDISHLIKAHLRRGLAYEQMEKFQEAREDIMTVRELQPENRQA
jgi:tetratricopeptide (TPR) repeat protein